MRLLKTLQLAVLLFMSAGKLSAQTTDPLNCDSFYVPKTFSLNCESGNCDFLPQFVCGVPEKFEMKIFDRWGNLIFTSSDGHVGWDGKNQKKKETCPMGVYYFTLKFSFQKGEKIKESAGYITLIR